MNLTPKLYWPALPGWPIDPEKGGRYLLRREVVDAFNQTPPLLEFVWLVDARKWARVNETSHFVYSPEDIVHLNFSYAGEVREHDSNVTTLFTTPEPVSPAPAEPGPEPIHLERLKLLPGNRDAVTLGLEGWAMLQAHHFASENGSAFPWDFPGLIVYYAEAPAAICQYQAPAWTNELEIALLYVRPEFRRKGICKMMMAELAEIARGLGKTYVSLAVTANNDVAWTAYKSDGFEVLAFTLRKGV